MKKPDGFIMAKLGEKECVIENIRRKVTCANQDDFSDILFLQLKEVEGGNLKCL